MILAPRHLRQAGVLLLLSLVAAGCTPPALLKPVERPAPGRLPASVVPTAYHLEWRIDPARTEFSGRVKIDLKLLGITDQVLFHADALRLKKVHFLIGDQRIAARAQPAQSGQVSEWRAIPKQPLPAGTASLLIDFEGPFDGHLAGLYRARQGERWYAYTQFEPSDARKAFPCLDEPGFKTPFEITVRVPRGLQAHSNAPLERTVDEGEWQRVVFRKTKPLPTYLVALVVGDFDVVSTQVGDLPLRGLAAHGKGAKLKAALRAHQEILPLLERYFDQPYPYAKLDLVALIEFAAGAMENAGLITYREELLLSDPQTRSLATEERIGAVAAHELAHQWFGNLVTMAWWNDLWLNEAFATWMGAKIVDQWHPEFEQNLDLLEGRSRVFFTDSLAAARAVRQPVASVVEAEGAFDGLTYVKGGSILEMVEHWLGPEVFRAGIVRYLETHAWGSATTEDLFAALQAESDLPVAKVARSFLDRPGVPLVTAQLSCASEGEVEVLLRQTRYRALGGDAPPTGEREAASAPWAIPLCLAWPEGPSLTQQCLLFDQPEQRVRLASKTCPEWIHPNAGEHGYFRWQIPAEHLPRIARWLEGREDLTRRRMRISLLGQAWGAMAAGAVDPSGVLALVELAGRSSDTRVQRDAASRVAGLAGLWPDLAETPAFRAFTDQVLSSTAGSLGWQPTKGEARARTLLRGKVLWTLGRFGGARQVRDGAAEQAKAYLVDPKKVSGDVAVTALRLARRDGAVTQDDLLRMLAGNPSGQVRVQLLAGMGSAPEGPELDAALDLMLDDRIRAQDVWHLLGGGFDGQARTLQTFEYLQSHYDALQARLPSFGNRAAGRLAQLVGYFCNAGDRDDARAFFLKQAAPDHARYLALGTETANRCIALREWGRASTEHYLEASFVRHRKPAIKPAPAPDE